MFVSGFLFSWLISILFLELISLRLFQIHFISIDALHKLNTSQIENYIEDVESGIDSNLDNENETKDSSDIEIVNGIETGHI